MQTKIKIPVLLTGLIVWCAATTVFALRLPSWPSIPTKDIIEIKKGVEYIQQQLSGVDRAAKANLVACGVYNGKTINFYNDPNGLGVLQLADIQTEAGRRKWCYNGTIEEHRWVLDSIHNKFNRNRLDAILSTEKKFSWNCVFNGGDKPLKVTCTIYRKNLYNRDETTFRTYDGTIRSENDGVIKKIVSKFNEDRWYWLWSDYSTLKYLTNGRIKFYKDGLKNYKHTGLIKGRIWFQADISSLNAQEEWLKKKIAETLTNITKQKAVISSFKDKIYYNNKSISSLTNKISELDRKKKQLDSYEIVTSPIKLHVIKKYRKCYWSWFRRKCKTVTWPVVASYSPIAYVSKSQLDKNYYDSLPGKAKYYEDKVKQISDQLRVLLEKKSKLIKEREKVYTYYKAIIKDLFPWNWIYVWYAKNRKYLPRYRSWFKTVNNTKYFYVTHKYSEAINYARKNNTFIYKTRRSWYHWHRVTNYYVLTKKGYDLYKQAVVLENKIVSLDATIWNSNPDSLQKTLNYYKDKLATVRSELGKYKDFISSSNSYKNRLKKKYDTQITSYRKSIDAYKRANVSINNQIKSVNSLITKLYKSKKDLETKLFQVIRMIDKITKPITVKIKVNGVCNPSYNNKNLRSLVFGDYLCSAGKFTNARKKGSLYTWTCQGFNGGSSVQCKAAAAIPRCDLAHADKDTYRIVNGKVDKCVIAYRTFSHTAVNGGTPRRSVAYYCGKWDGSRYGVKISKYAKIFDKRDNKLLYTVSEPDFSNYEIYTRTRHRRRHKDRHHILVYKNGRQIYYHLHKGGSSSILKLICFETKKTAYWRLSSPQW